MSNTSLAAQAVANQRAIAESVIARGGSAQPSFIGQDWLVALNLGVMTAGFFLCVMLVGYLAADGWRNRVADPQGSPASIGRRIVLAFACAGVLRFAGAAAALWGWNPSDPSATLAASFLQKVLDPVAAIFFGSGLAMSVLAGRALLSQLRRDPWPVDMWDTLPQLKRPATVTGLCFIGAIGVVLTR